MSELNKEQAYALVEALRRMADKIENGYQLDEQQVNMIVRLFRGFNIKPKKEEYKAKTARLQPQRLLYEEEEEQEL